MIASLLSRLFPPRLPSHIVDWEAPADPREEQGSAGKVKQHYRDAIQRHFDEESSALNLRAELYQHEQPGA